MMMMVVVWTFTLRSFTFYLLLFYIFGSTMLHPPSIRSIAAMCCYFFSPLYFLRIHLLLECYSTALLLVAMLLTSFGLFPVSRCSVDSSRGTTSMTTSTFNTDLIHLVTKLYKVVLQICNS